MKRSTFGRNLSVGIRPSRLSSLVGLFKSARMTCVDDRELRCHHYSSCATPTPSICSLSLGVPRCVVGPIDHQGAQAQARWAMNEQHVYGFVGHEWGSWFGSAGHKWEEDRPYVVAPRQAYLMRPVSYDRGGPWVGCGIHSSGFLLVRLTPLSTPPHPTTRLGAMELLEGGSFQVGLFLSPPSDSWALGAQGSNPRQEGISSSLSLSLSLELEFSMLHHAIKHM